MRRLLLASILVLGACTAEPGVPDAPKPKEVVPDYSLDAFGGHLLGTDRGEWIGELMFQNADGDLETILKENVLGIVKNAEGVFAFTGLAHMGTNEGYIYAISRTSEGHIAASRMGRLPGTPSRVAQLQPNGATSFLVFSGFSQGRQLFECYQLVGKIVSRGQTCLPPK
jgi:hypothetical protein